MFPIIVGGNIPENQINGIAYIISILACFICIYTAITNYSKDDYLICKLLLIIVVIADIILMIISFKSLIELILIL